MIYVFPAFEDGEVVWYYTDTASTRPCGPFATENDAIDASRGDDLVYIVVSK